MVGAVMYLVGVWYASCEVLVDVQEFAVRSLVFIFCVEYFITRL
jgi:hypothetical protein